MMGQYTLYPVKGRAARNYLLSLGYSVATERLVIPDHLGVTPTHDGVTYAVMREHESQLSSLASTMREEMTNFTCSLYWGRSLILTTSNGTRALFACSQQRSCLAGSFYNGEAVVTQALRLAQERQVNISIVCAAEYGCFSLEDSSCAGYLALELLRRRPSDLEVFDCTYAAVTLYQQYPPARLREETRSARELIAGGQELDLSFCLNMSVSKSVPLITGQDQETGLLILETIK